MEQNTINEETDFDKWLEAIQLYDEEPDEFQTPFLDPMPTDHLRLYNFDPKLDPLDHLPDEISQLLLSFLVSSRDYYVNLSSSLRDLLSASRVSKRWHQLAWDTGLFSQLRLTRPDLIQFCTLSETTVFQGDKEINNKIPYAVFSIKLWKGSYVIGACGDGQIRIWDLRTGVRKAVFQESKTPNVKYGQAPRVLALSRWGDYLLTSGDNLSIHIWSLDRFIREDVRNNYAPPVCLRILRGHTLGVKCFARWGGMLWSGSKDHSIRAWRLNSEDIKALDFNSNPSNSSSLSSNSSSFSSNSLPFCNNCSFDESFIKWEAHKGWIYDLKVWRRRLYSCSEDGYIKAWSITGQCELSIDCGTSVYCLKPWGGILFSTNYKGDVTAWNEEGKTHKEWKEVFGEDKLARNLLIWEGLLIVGGEGSMKVKSLYSGNDVGASYLTSSGIGTVYRLKKWKEGKKIVMASGHQMLNGRTGERDQSRVSLWEVEINESSVINNSNNNDDSREEGGAEGKKLNEGEIRKGGRRRRKEGKEDEYWEEEKEA
eukprot:TRINITY_DN3848_c0_g1_i2.p1 TRINITY_DN3848_c0_g1~~TRINITY_DN3848_c0_g1_i2.p1  ORF type:complete len:539 (+),score=138.91 TRINITY_DN3848_c0_g1_i2:170-1786(+)